MKTPSSPPRPHDPADRVPLARIGEWEIRRFEEDGVLFGYSAPRGFLHLQLWHPRREVSLLTPSRLTAGRYEAFPIAGWKLTAKSLDVIGGVIRGEHGLLLPSEARLRALERWFVTAAERVAVRSWMAKRIADDRFGRTGNRLLLLVALLFSIACAPAPVRSSAQADAGALERDRRAILAMAGEFEVRFEFRETTALVPGYEPRPPSRSAGFERVEVAADEGRRILLRHVLVTRSGHVTKHWSQDWRYEDRLVYEFRGDRVWAPRTLSSDEAAGAWTQAVSEVDESPRYESVGRWTHFGNVSAWTSGETWRPLPRREHTKRNDYDVLVAVNRHEIVPDGWVHAQDNLKLALRGAGPTALAREVGLNNYRRDSSVDFGPARAYARETAEFWRAVRREWEARLDGSSALRVRERDGEHTLIEQTLTLAEEARSDATAADRVPALVAQYVEEE